MSTQPDKIRCAIYTRKSTLKGLEQAYNSLEAQEDRCKSFIELHEGQGWVFVQSFSDAGISGGTTQRPGLKAMLDAARAKKFDLVVVFKLDRLARNQRDFLNMLDTLAKNGVDVASATEPFDSSSYLGRAMRNLLGVFAEMEREMISERTREKAEASRKKGLYVSGPAPLGYVRGTNKLLEIDPKGAALVKRIFREYAGEASTYSLAADLNKEGTLRTKRGGGTRPWMPMDIQRILRNVLYAGYIASGNERYQGQHKALISQELWEKVQAKLDTASQEVQRRVKATRPRMVYPLTRLLRCGRCGKPMTGSYGKKGDKLYRYYTCATRKKYGEVGCTCPSLNADQIEGFVREQLMSLRDDEEFIAAVLSRMPDVPGGHISDCLFNMEKLLQYGDPTETARILRQVFSTITFDWENEKIDFQYKKLA